ncbi:ATP-binding protein [Mesonia maritima]|uniref:histidine kinase n=1 Tax=Mesonia maritima TaxID=1793873 RepID=A0ABU1K9E1_9FLAO|nr:ATP-binding protein [Mesonia maritima]MDR6302221.1 hypothetical protein [Mesonia maritima]
MLIFLVFFCSAMYSIAQECSLDESAPEAELLKKTISSSVQKEGYKNISYTLEGLYQALKIARSQNNTQNIGIVNFYLAKTYFKLENYNDAEEHVSSAISNLEKTNPSQCLYLSYLLYAQLNLKYENFNETDRYILKADSLPIKITLEVKALKYKIQGEKLIQQENFTEAIVYFKQAEEIFRKNDNQTELAENYYNIGSALLQLKDYESALTNAEKALVIAKNQQLDILAIKILELFSEIYSASNEPILAFEYASKSSQYKDSLLNFSNRMISNEIAKRKTNSSQDTISKLSMTNSEQEKSLKFNQLAIVLSVLLITILSLLTLSLYKNNNLRAKANTLLQKKNKELVKAKEKAEAATKAREQFLSTITHELRTPIYAITGLTYLLIKEDPTDAQKEHLNSLKYSGEHLLSLINNILDLNKLEANKVRKVSTDFHLKSHMKNFLNTLRKPAEDKNVLLHLEMDEKIPVKLNGDMLKVSQVLINLVGNSIKFAENGEVWIRLQLVKESDKKVTIRFEIEDNGVGIPKRKQKSIFQKFDQGPDEINVKYGGTGLGLPIVKNLLLFLGSDIHLESEEGKGSLFYFELEFEKVLEKTNKDLKIKKVSQEEQTNLFRGKRILVVEDNKLNQKITKKILERCEMDIDLADNGKVAVEKALKTSYDVILMDIHMPIMDGIKATETIRKHDSSTPIIALTAVSINEGVEEFLEHGFTEIIPKPYKTELFFEKIYKVLKIRSQK